MSTHTNASSTRMSAPGGRLIRVDGDGMRQMIDELSAALREIDRLTAERDSFQRVGIAALERESELRALLAEARPSVWVECDNWETTAPLATPLLLHRIDAALKETDR